MKISDLLSNKAQTISAEIIPPRNGTESSVVLEQIEILKNAGVDFISVTKGAGGSLRGGTLPIAQMVATRYEIASLAHFTCRDYTPEEIENALMDHHYFGISNILALRGDPPDGQPDYFKPGENKHSYAWQLVEQIKNLNNGKYLSRPGYDSSKEKRASMKTNFCIGVAAHPEHEPFEDAVNFFCKKVDMGAEFGITQMIFSAEPYARFIEACIKKGVHAPILPGFRILTQASTAKRMIDKFGARIPADWMQALEKAKTAKEGKSIGLDFSEKLCANLKRYGAPGVHLFVMNDAQTAADLAGKFKKT